MPVRRRVLLGYAMSARRLAGPSSRTGGSLTFSGPFPDGTPFTITDLWGQTRVQFGSPDETWYLRSIVINGIEVVDEPFDFGVEGRSFEDVDVIFSAYQASIAGRAVDERGAAAAGASVVVFPVDAARWFTGSRGLKSATLGTDGAFVIKGCRRASTTRLPSSASMTRRDRCSRGR